MSFAKILNGPDSVLAQFEFGWKRMTCAGGFCWESDGLWVDTEKTGDGLIVRLRAEVPVLRIALKWNVITLPGARMMCDCWERGYGDMEWRGIVPERAMPWFFMLHDGKIAHGYGVKTGPKAMCFWQVNENEMTLCLDVRNGGQAVALGGRQLELATVVSREGREGETPFYAAHAFCKQMCPSPILPDGPVYGGNNWYYAYGKSSHGEILEDSRLVASLSPSGGARPFMVIDMGWELPRSSPETSLWHGGNGMFPDMGRLADEMRKIGVRPGIWVRPLALPDNAPDSVCLPPVRQKRTYAGKYLDPTIPGALGIVRDDIAKQREWGFELVKHDFTTFDILGRWGFDMGGELTGDGWGFYNRSKTTAEIIANLYRAIGEACAGALIIGCNTVGHIGAGIFHMQRTGDDTSGRQWERTRKMGVNTLAYAMPKHGAFYASDADCAGVTENMPWELNRQWLELLSRSGTPLFVSAPCGITPEQRRAIREAFAAAARGPAPAEPLDWMETTCPGRWILDGKETVFRWNRQDAVEFLGP